MKNRVTKDAINRLYWNQVFVFGSNESGIHGGGAARQAWKQFGAHLGVGFGKTGRCFAIPTKSWFIRGTLPLQVIEFYVARFLEYAYLNPNQTFLVTKIGCGLAGLKVEQVAPMFVDAVDMDNVHLPQEFWDILNKEDEKM